MIVFIMRKIQNISLVLLCNIFQTLCTTPKNIDKLTISIIAMLDAEFIYLNQLNYQTKI